MTAEKRAPTHKQAHQISATTPRITHSSSKNEHEKSTDKGEAWTGWGWGGAFKQFIFDGLVIQP